VRGRSLTAEDSASAPLTVVINEALARRFWPGENPVGKRLKQGRPEWTSPWRVVAGVVGDVKFEGLA